MNTYIYNSIFYSQQEVEAIQVSTNGWIYIYIWMLFSLKKKDILSHAATWMNQEDIMLREIN